MAYRIASAVLLFLSLIVIGEAFVPNLSLSRRTQTANKVNQNADILDSKRASVAPGIELRIQPLGDSITSGFESSDNNGYRLQLLNDLSGSNVVYVGSVRNGDMADNFNEGHPTATINTIAGFANHSLPERPNIVLIHAGTNDLGSNPPVDPYGTAADRLGALIDEVIAACPDATVLVAQIITNANATTKARIKSFNAQIPGVVDVRIAKGHQNIAAVDFSSLTDNDLNDGIHPTDEGYKKMGDIWFSAIQEAASKGWIEVPVGPDPSRGGFGRQKCVSGLLWYQAQGGAQIASGIGPGNGTIFVDIDGDGVDDYVWVDENGALTVYINGGPRTSGSNDWVWIPLNNGKPINTGGAPRDQIRLADINGDGKADYLIVDPKTGGVSAYLNGGHNVTAPTGWTWLPQGPITGCMGDGAGVRFADINPSDHADFTILGGDGKADYIWLSNEGAATIYINVIGKASTNWVPLNGGQPVASGSNGSRQDIRFADINGDGRPDYIYIHPLDGAMDLYTNELGINSTSWAPQGLVASGVGFPGSSIRFGALTHSGRADYIPVVASTGGISPYLNGCKN